MLADLQGRVHPTTEPEAELWFGAHPSDPARLLDPDGSSRPLTDVVAHAPPAVLGDDVVSKLGPRLPFLLKLLAIEHPLSLQVHPSAEQAVAGFAAEEARGVPLGAPQRTYRDTSAKPELLHALTPVDALCGFRDTRVTVALLRELSTTRLSWLEADLVARGEDALSDALGRLLRWPVPDRAQLVDTVVASATVVARTGGPHAHAAGWVVRLGAMYPDDPGVVVALLLNLVRLRPGESLHLSAGMLHAYLRGTAVEVMATSDNVIRGGLTVKHVDGGGLLDTVETRVIPEPRVPAVPVPGGAAFPTDTPQFALERLTPIAGPLRLARRGPEILLALAGDVEVTADGTTLVLMRGQAAFVPACTTTVAVAGTGTLIRATTGVLVSAVHQDQVPRR